MKEFIEEYMKDVNIWSVNDLDDIKELLEDFCEALQKAKQKEAIEESSNWQMKEEEKFPYGTNWKGIYPDEVFAKNASCGMKEFNLSKFVKDYKSLYAVILKSMKEYAEQFKNQQPNKLKTDQELTRINISAEEFLKRKGIEVVDGLIYNWRDWNGKKLKEEITNQDLKYLLEEYSKQSNG